MKRIVLTRGARLELRAASREHPREPRRARVVVGTGYRMGVDRDDDGILDQDDPQLN